MRCQVKINYVTDPPLNSCIGDKNNCSLEMTHLTIILGKQVSFINSLIQFRLTFNSFRPDVQKMIHSLLSTRLDNARIMKHNYIIKLKRWALFSFS